MTNNDNEYWGQCCQDCQWGNHPNRPCSTCHKDANKELVLKAIRVIKAHENLQYMPDHERQAMDTISKRTETGVSLDDVTAIMIIKLNTVTGYWVPRLYC